MQSVEESFLQIFRYMGIPKNEIRMDASFTKDFHFNEAQFTCLIFYIGLYFKINVREKDYNEFNTVSGAIEFVKRKFADKKV